MTISGDDITSAYGYIYTGDNTDQNGGWYLI